MKIFLFNNQLYIQLAISVLKYSGYVEHKCLVMLP